MKGFLVVYMTGMDDLPVGLFADRASAERLARQLPACGEEWDETTRRSHPALDRALAYRHIEGCQFHGILVVEFADGVTAGLTQLGGEE